MFFRPDDVFLLSYGKERMHKLPCSNGVLVDILLPLWDEIFAKRGDRGSNIESSGEESAGAHGAHESRWDCQLGGTGSQFEA